MKFWNSVKTKLAGRLWSFVARIVTKQAINAVIFQKRIVFEILLSRWGRKILDAAAAKAIMNANDAVCHL